MSTSRRWPWALRRLTDGERARLRGDDTDEVARLVATGHIQCDSCPWPAEDTHVSRTGTWRAALCHACAAEWSDRDGLAERQVKLCVGKRMSGSPITLLYVAGPTPPTTRGRLAWYPMRRAPGRLFTVITPGQS